jgi:hypothetical protein
MFQRVAAFYKSSTGHHPARNRSQAPALPELKTRSRCSGGSGLVNKLPTIITTDAATTQVPATPNGFFQP